MHIANLFNAEELEKTLACIERLKPDIQRLWGKMSVAQMLATSILLIASLMNLRQRINRVFSGS